MTNQRRIRWFVNGEEIQPKPKPNIESALINGDCGNWLINGESENPLINGDPENSLINGHSENLANQRRV